MFSVEIDFHDGVSAPETVLVRRPFFTIGGSEDAHVSVEDMRRLQYDLQIGREAGRRFRCRPVGLQANSPAPAILEGVFDGTTRVDLGGVSLQITSLDLDLILRDGEPPDRAGVRIVRQASVSRAPRFPALIFPGKNPFTVSFVPDQPVYIGRSKECTVRLDSQEISGRHARLGYEGGKFWIEDLGSTNGTFINQQQISGKVTFAPGTPVMLGRETLFFGANSDEQLNAITRSRDDRPRTIVPERRYPVLLSLSEVVRPARMVVPIGSTIHIGRDPKSEMWLGAPHISRQHCQVALSKTGTLTVTDCSTNGTAYDGGLLQKGNSLDLQGVARVLDFGGAVTVAICFSPEDEQIFTEAGGNVSAFLGAAEEPRQEEKLLIQSPRKNPGSGSRVYRPVETRRTPQLELAELRDFVSKLPTIKKVLALLWIVAVLIIAMIIGSLIIGFFR